MCCGIVSGFYFNVFHNALSLIKLLKKKNIAHQGSHSYIPVFFLVKSSAVS